MTGDLYYPIMVLGTTINFVLCMIGYILAKRQNMEMTKLLFFSIGAAYAIWFMVIFIGFLIK